MQQEPPADLSGAETPETEAVSSKVPAFERHYLLLPKLGIGYCRVPKAANSSVRFLLAKRFGLTSDDPAQRPNKDTFWLEQPQDKALSLTTEGYLALPVRKRPWCFTLVRNPVSRLYSAWNNKIIENKGELSGRFRDMGAEQGMSFDAFVDCVAASPDETCDIHVRSQMAILSYKGKVLPDFVGRVETVRPDWEHIRYEIRVRTGRRIPALLQKNVRANVQPDVAKEIAAPVLAKIVERYQDDFKRFYPREMKELGL